MNETSSINMFFLFLYILFTAFFCCIPLAFVGASPLYYHVFPGPAPRTPSALIRNEPISASFQKNDVLMLAGLHDVRCVPHGQNPYLGWDCTGHTMAMKEVREAVETNGDSLAKSGLYFKDITNLYQNGLTFSADVDTGVKVSIDPTVASLDDVQKAVTNITMVVGQQYRAQQPQPSPDQVEQERRAANKASWQG